MFCGNCGTQLSDGEKFCPKCGAPVQETGNDEVKGFSADNAGQTTNAYSNANVNMNAGAAANNGFAYTAQMPAMPLKTDRSLLIYVLLSIVTCGIYGWIFIYQLIQDVNIACDGDGDETPGFLMFFLLTFVTCGVYGYVWYYKLGNRLQNNCARYGQPTNDGGTAVLLWMVFGVLLCGVGAFIGWNILITNTNTVCQGYNRSRGFTA